MVRSPPKVRNPSSPLSGSAVNSRSIGTIAFATGSHCRQARNLFTRIPIRNTTTSWSYAAVCRPSMTLISTPLG